jgi:TolB protein
MLRRRPSRWPAGLAVTGLLLGLALAAFLALPRITGLAPADQALEVSTRAAVRITFNRDMNHASVEAALTLTPAAPGAVTWAGRTFVFTPAAPWAENTRVTVSLSGGRSAQGFPLLGVREWSFTVGGRRLAYLSGAVPNLWILATAEGAQPRQVTAEPHAVYDFDLAPDGAWAVYSALRADGGADLRQINLDGSSAAEVLACADAACLSPAVSPDGAWVAYERRAVTAGPAGEATFGAPRVHLLSRRDYSDTPLGPNDSQTRTPRWGPDGRLSYLDETRQVLAVHDPASGAETFIPDTSGESGTWSPDGQFIVFPEIFFPPEPTPAPDAITPTEHTDNFYSHLLRVTIATNAAQDLSGAGITEDSSPAYSPSGAWLAFARRGLGAGDWTPGRQLWLMRADGSQARPLSTEPLFNHSAFQWSADEAQLVYMRFNAAEPGTPAEIWLMNADGTGARRLAVGGYLPQWVP